MAPPFKKVMKSTVRVFILLTIVYIILHIYAIVDSQDKRLLAENRLLRSTYDVITENKPSINRITYRNGAWQVLSGGRYRLYLKSAYNDDRKDPYVVRILALSNAVLDVNQTSMYCVLWYNHHVTTTEVHGYTDMTGWSFRMENTFQKQYSIECIANTIQQEPVYVSLTFDRHVISTKLNIIHPMEYANKINGLCVPPLYGSMSEKDIRAFVEWMEYYLHLGIQEFNLYNVSLQQNDLFSKVLLHYKQKGVLRLFQHPHAGRNIDDEHIYDVTQLTVRTTVNDCLLRNYKKYEYILVVDLDEYIVPHNFLQYDALVQKLSLSGNFSQKVHSIKFSNKNFFLDYGPDNQSESGLLMDRYTKYSPTGMAKFKALIFPTKCLLAHNHGCLKATNENSDKYLLPIQDGAVHHYRRACARGYTPSGTRFKQNLRDQSCLLALQNSSVDLSMRKYVPVVKELTDKVLKELDLEWLPYW